MQLTTNRSTTRRTRRIRVATPMVAFDAPVFRTVRSSD